MFKKIIILVVVVIGALAVVISMQPEEFTVERSHTIAAPASAVFTHVNNLKKWNAWSPWAELDPNMTQSFDGPPSGVGASVRWEGNYQVGVGTMTIEENQPPKFVKFKMDFEKPFASTSISTFSFEEMNGQTKVTWKMDGRNNFVGKAMSLFFDCEKMVGEQFEKGLLNLEKQVITPVS